MHPLHRKHPAKRDTVGEHLHETLDDLAHELARPHHDELNRQRMREAAKRAGNPRREAQARRIHPQDS